MKVQVNGPLGPCHLATKVRLLMMSSFRRVTLLDRALTC